MSKILEELIFHNKEAFWVIFSLNEIYPVEYILS